MPSIGFCANVDGEVVYYNKMLRDLTGLSATALLWIA